VRQREHEVAVRIAVGADGRSITALFVREGMLVAALGLIAGVAGAMSIGRLLESQLFGIAATDPVTLAVATIARAQWKIDRLAKQVPLDAIG